MSSNPTTNLSDRGTRTYQLQYLSLFGGLDRNQLQELLDHGRWKEVGMGDALSPALGDGEVMIVVCGALELMAGRPGDTHRILGRGSVRAGSGSASQGHAALNALTPVSMVRLSAAAASALASAAPLVWGRIQNGLERESMVERAERAA